MTLCRRGIFRALRWRWSWRSWPLGHIGELPRRERAASLSSCDDGGTAASYAVGIYSSRRIARAVWSGSISWRSWRCRRPTVGEIDERAKSGFLGETSALLFPVNWPEAIAYGTGPCVDRACVNRSTTKTGRGWCGRSRAAGNDARRHSLLGRYLPIELLMPPINRDDRGSLELSYSRRSIQCKRQRPAP